MATPVAYGLVGSILKGLIARLYGMYRSSQHLHTLHVDMLALYVKSTHIDRARHVHKRTCRSRCYTVLTSTSLGYDASLAHLAGKEYLTQGVVDLMSPRVVQVLTLEIEFASIFLTHASGIVER